MFKCLRTGRTPAAANTLGFVGSVQGALNGKGSALTSSVNTHRGVSQCQDVFGGDDGVTQHMA